MVLNTWLVFVGFYFLVLEKKRFGLVQIISITYKLRRKMWKWLLMHDLCWKPIPCKLWTCGTNSDVPSSSEPSGKFCYKALALKYCLVIFQNSTQCHKKPQYNAERYGLFNVWWFWKCWYFSKLNFCSQICLKISDLMLSFYNDFSMFQIPSDYQYENILDWWVF